MIVSDKKLFAFILYSAFVNSRFLIPDRDIWEKDLVIGTSVALAISGAIVAPFILLAIIYGLGFGAEGIVVESFGAWLMSLYEGTIASGSLVSTLQSIGATGSLGTLGTAITSGFGAAIGTLIGAIGGSKLATYISEMALNSNEEQILRRFVQIERNAYDNIDVFILTPALLYNDTILKYFFETFISSSPFANSKLFKFDFKENNLSKLKLEEENINNTVYNLLISEYDKSRVKYIFHDDYYLIGYNLDLIDYKPPNRMINLLVEIWNVINGNIIINIDINKILEQINEKIDKTKDDINKFSDKVSEEVNEQIDKTKSDINKFNNKVSEGVNEQIYKTKSDINKFSNEVNEKVNEQVSKTKSDINEFSNNVREKVSEQYNKILKFFHFK
jgi:hypothetical protein